MVRETAVLTNVGKLLERRGKEFLGSEYKDPISSFSDLQEFSVLKPEVVLYVITCLPLSFPFKIINSVSVCSF